MKNIYLILALICGAQSISLAQSQWTGSVPGPIYYNSGDVGIGTSVPLSGGPNASWLTLNGTTYGGGLISSVSGVKKGYSYYDANTNAMALQGVSGVDVVLWPGANTIPALVAKTSGYVGINTMNPTSLLNVSTFNNSFKEGINVDNIAIGGTAWAAFNTRGNSANIITGRDATHYGYFAIGASNDDGATSVTRLLVDNVGNVGIGTTSPFSPLHVYQTAPDAAGVTIQGNTISPDGSLHYVAMTLDGDHGNGTGNYSQIRSFSNLYETWGSQLAFYTTQTGVGNTLKERMRIDWNGYVGIGTGSPDDMLTVNGKIHASEVRVTAVVPYPDYVFKPAYRLPKLAEVKTYIDQNHHLPEVPTEADVAKNGMNLGQSETLLLKKVEELTLYLIELKNSNDKLKNQNSLLKKEQQIIIKKLKRNNIK